MDRFNSMLAFVRVVELNSFTKASVSLNVPKATVSAQIHALEQRLHVKLLHRTTRHVGVTCEGLLYYERIKGLLDEIEDADVAITKASAVPKGKLRVALPGALGRRVIIPALHDFLRRYPDIDLEVDCNDCQSEFLQDGIDCVIRGESSIDDSLVARRLDTFDLVTCASPDYIHKYGIPANLDDLDNHLMIHLFSLHAGKLYPLHYFENGLRRGVYGRYRIAMNDSDGCVKAALAGMGIVQLLNVVVKDEIADGRLVPILDAYSPEKVNVSLLYPRNRHPTARLRAFIDWTVESFGREQRHSDSRQFECHHSQTLQFVKLNTSSLQYRPLEPVLN